MASPPPPTTAPPQGKPSVEEPEPEKTPAQPPDTPTQVGYLPDGSLLVAGTHSLVMRTSSGASTRFDSVPDGATIHFSSQLSGVVIETKNQVEFLQTPSLERKHAGPGYALENDPVAVVDDGHTALVQVGDRVLRVALDRGPKGGRLASATPVAGGERLNLTLIAEDLGGVESFLVDTKSGDVVANGIPIRLFLSVLPRVAQVGRVGFVVEGDKVERVNLETGAVAHSAKIRCKGGEVGNPTPSADGNLLLVTCGDDGVVLDGVTLREKRRIVRIVPGCDNGPFLGGVILEDGHTLHLEGCGGVAALDLTSGKYGCADEPGLLGAPYPEPLPAGAQRRPRIPRGRESVPRCTRAGEQAAVMIGDSRSYGLVYGDSMLVVHGKSSFALEEGAQVPVLAPDEKSLAYVLNDKVIVRDLPSGRARGKWALSEL